MKEHIKMLGAVLSHSQTTMRVNLNYDVTKLLSWGFWKFMRKSAWEFKVF